MDFKLIQFLVFSLFIRLNVALAPDNARFESELREAILTDYVPDLRPSVTYEVIPTIVTMNIRLLQIFELEEKSQILRTSVVLHQQWKDPRLTWNPADYGGIDVVSLEPSSLWVPDVLLINNAEKVYSGRNVGKDYPVKVSHDGSMMWYSHIVLKSYCKMKVRLFPFDEQFCSLIFAPWTYHATEVQLGKGSLGHKALMNYTENSAWELDAAHTVNTTVVDELFRDQPKPSITFFIHLRRKVFYYFFFLFAPCALTSILMCMVFLLPPDCGERMVVGVTNLLALTVFYMLAAKNIPETSEDVPLMGRYYSLTIGEMSICMFLTSAVLRFHHNKSAMPKWIKVYILGHLARLLQIETPQNAPVTKENLEKREESEDESSNLVIYANDGIVVRRGATGLGLMADRVINESKAADKQGEWQLAGKVINFLFLILHLASTFIIVLSVFLQAPGFIASRPEVPLPGSAF